ncbi:MAG: hypothetical protein FD161_4799 [Limisphaerales bacterium]|nr:MAG: hypothetical protein FD161_4799 [Limisphaerales bacterium]TXT44431.1 MAG: hypothetical protein FD140_4868 [Limisphaerales bacterium]
MVSRRGNVDIARGSRTGHEPLRSFNVGMREMKNAPAYANGRLFFRNEKGGLACWQIGE